MPPPCHGFLAILIGFGLTNARALDDDAAAHWAFQPIRRPPVSESDAANPIDAFLDAKLAKRRLTAAPEASRSILLRRVYLDLIGLPPTRGELREFLRDDSPTAYENALDRLLESPHYGERWGRHWMDVWRYSDWFGNEGKDRITNGLPHLWRWRDWIVDSLNADKGYNRMILEMLAGDEIAPSDPEVLRATGFLVRNRYRLDRNVPLAASVEHTGRAFLGLTLDCARCHEHKYDPITHEDYFAFRAFFEPIGFRTDRLPGEPDISVDGLPRVYDADLKAATYLFEKGDERKPVKEKPVTARLPEFFKGRFNGGEPIPISEIPVPSAESNPFLKEWVCREEIQRLEIEIGRLEKALAAEAKTLTEKQLAANRARLAATRAVMRADQLKNSGASKEKIEPASWAASTAQRALAIAKAEENIAIAEEKAAKFREQLKTDPSRKAQLVASEKEIAKYEAERKKAAESKPSAIYAPLGEVYPENSTGRRTALARWLVSENNPLTARVAVNHIWMRHFGEPLVPTIFDFGLAGKPPTHPELLDWLAAEFIESGWKMKHLHRLIVTSRAYRRGSSGARLESNLASDPENRFLWRMNSRRMEAEVVRDSILHLAGKLDPKLGGPEIPVKEADSVLRRSFYFKHSGVDIVPLLAEFDPASVLECYRRRDSIIPQQALALSNSPMAQRTARLIAANLAETTPSPSEFVAAAFETTLARSPGKAELAECLSFLDEQSRMLEKAETLTLFSSGPKVDPPPSADPARRARENLVHILINHNDYVTIR